MKYVMFTNKQGYSLPIFGPDMANHCDLQGMGKNWVPTSAGHFSITSQHTSGRSTSLGLSPHKQDANICILVLGEMEALVMMAQDLEDNMARREAILKAKEDKARAKWSNRQHSPSCDPTL